jgi:hypothetical protein
MSKWIMWNLLTLDGLFDGGESWALDWQQDVRGGELGRRSIERRGTTRRIDERPSRFTVGPKSRQIGNGRR